MADESTSGDKFIFTFIVNICTASVCFTLFLLLRKAIPEIYECRCHARNPKDQKNEVLPPPGGLFGWVGPTFRYPDDKALETHGLDALIYFKYLRMGIFIMLVQTIYGVCVLIPINVVWGIRSQNDPNAANYLAVSTADWLDLAGMTSIPPQDRVLWAHLFSILTNSLLAYGFLWLYYNEYAMYRQIYKSTANIRNCAVLVRDVPTSETVAAINAKLQWLFPGEIARIAPVFASWSISRKQSKLMDAIIKLEKAEAFLLKKNKRPTHKTKLFGGEKVDSIDTYTAEVHRIRREIHEMHDSFYAQADTSRNSFGGSVFIIFKNISSALKASSVCLSVTPGQWLPNPAPEPRDVYWRGLSVMHYSRLLRSVLLNTAIFFLTVFWAIPVTMLTSLMSLDSLASIPGLSFLADAAQKSTLLTSFLTGYLPPILIIVLLAIVPIIIRLFVMFLQGLPAKGQIDLSVMNKYFAFKIVNVFFVVIIAGSIFDALAQILENPNFTDIVNLLAAAVPAQSFFFINYVVTLSMMGHCLELLRPVPLVLRWLFQNVLASTKRDFRNAEAPGPYPYEIAYVSHMVVFVIASTYSTLSPFICPFALLYFIFAYMAGRYLILFVHIPNYDGGGAAWPSVFFKTCTGLFLYQITLVGIFIVYRFPAAVIVSAILCGCSLVLSWVGSKHFQQVAFSGSLEACVSVPYSKAFNESLNTAYVSPFLKPPPIPESQTDDPNEWMLGVDPDSPAGMNRYTASGQAPSMKSQASNVQVSINTASGQDPSMKSQASNVQVSINNANDQGPSTKSYGSNVQASLNETTIAL